jgi:hypothetical protein
MNILHIIRSKPSEETLNFITELSEGNNCQFIKLFEGAVDYDELVKLVFAFDRVISWW